MAVSGADVLNNAMNTWGGLPYIWAQRDCSWLTQQAYAAFGITLPRTASQQFLATQRISFADLQPGDLLFANLGGAGAPSNLPGHVAIYAGNGQVFQALQTGTNIGLFPVNSQNWVAFGRVSGANPGGTVTGTPPMLGVSLANGSGSGSSASFLASTPDPEHCVWDGPFGCIISKHAARGLVGALVIAGGVVVGILGVGFLMVYGLDKAMPGITGKMVRSATPSSVPSRGTYVTQSGRIKPLPSSGDVPSDIRVN